MTNPTNILGTLKVTTEAYKDFREFLENTKKNSNTPAKLKQLIDKILSADVLKKMSKQLETKYNKTTMSYWLNYEPQKLIQVLSMILSLYTNPFSMHDKPFNQLSKLRDTQQQDTKNGAEILHYGNSEDVENLAKNVIAKAKEIKELFLKKAGVNTYQELQDEHKRAARILWSNLFNGTGNLLADHNLFENEKFITDLRSACELTSTYSSFAIVNFIEDDNRKHIYDSKYDGKCILALQNLLGDTKLLEKILELRTLINDEHLTLDFEMLFLFDKGLVSQESAIRSSKRIIDSDLNMSDAFLMYPIINFQTEHKLGDKVSLPEIVV